MANPGERVRYQLTTRAGCIGSGFADDPQSFSWSADPTADDITQSVLFELVPDASGEGSHEIDGDDWRELEDTGMGVEHVHTWVQRGAGLGSAVQSAIDGTDPDGFDGDYEDAADALRDQVRAIEDACRTFCGYRIEGPGGNPGTEPDCGEELHGRYWWTLVLGGKGDTIVSDGDWATFAEALADAHKHASAEFDRMLVALRELHEAPSLAFDDLRAIAARGLGMGGPPTAQPATRAGYTWRRTHSAWLLEDEQRATVGHCYLATSGQWCALPHSDDERYFEGPDAESQARAHVIQHHSGAPRITR